jgi:hypothetical protein
VGLLYQHDRHGYFSINGVTEADLREEQKQAMERAMEEYR